MLDNEGVLSIIPAKTPSRVAIGRENGRWLVLTTWCFLFVKNRGNLIGIFAFNVNYYPPFTIQMCVGSDRQNTSCVIWFIPRILYRV